MSSLKVFLAFSFLAISASAGAQTAKKQIVCRMSFGEAVFTGRGPSLVSAKTAVKRDCMRQCHEAGYSETAAVVACGYALDRTLRCN